jgi:hypothetical protein
MTCRCRPAGGQTDTHTWSIHIHTLAYMHAHTSVYTYTWHTQTHTSTYPKVHISAHTHIHTSLGVYTLQHTCAYTAYTQMYTHTRSVHTNILQHTHTYTSACIQIPFMYTWIHPSGCIHRHLDIHTTHTSAPLCISQCTQASVHTHTSTRGQTLALRIVWEDYFMLLALCSSLLVRLCYL